MLGKQRLVVGFPYGRIAVDLRARNLRARKELVWAVVPPLLLALAFLSLLLLQAQTSGPISFDEETLAPAMQEPYSPNVDWYQTDQSSLSYSRPLR